jgi:RNA polymerase sigma factor (sigma-70 family)
MELHEWLLTQPKEVQEEFEQMEASQKTINNKELNVSQIYFGEKPISKDTLELIRYQLENLTDKQKEVYNLYHLEGKTQEETAEILGITKQAVSCHVKGIKKKIKKLL